MSIKPRKQNHLEPNPTNLDNLLISWKYYQGKKDKVGQSLSDWENENDGKHLRTFLDKIDYIQKTSYLELLKSGIISLYGKFPSPEVTDFSCPSDLNESSNWGTIQKLHQHSRVAGFLSDGFFYVVFLDKDHRFYKSGCFHKKKKG
ncbi:hypothetical protein QV06_07880 [Gallibacterium genomosp. 3]|uniref:Uncharacterized protein n=1 Tax=Gallibacterium genomosp. 3 TaxID=505345 RepID=A0A1A7PQX4_9PAST|nr:hypothetical protein [Gallibacterium genomosp. 3]OBX04151.1 hypothetical protein QV06_07880 [Gallibacterium genomosp. 3]